MLKKLFISGILLLLLKSSGFSQTDTSGNNVILRPRVATLVIADLLRYDASKEIIRLFEEQIRDYRGIIIAKDQQISGGETRERNLNTIITSQDLQIQSWKDRYDESQKLLKRSVRVGRLKVVLIIGVAAYGIYQTFK